MADEPQELRKVNWREIFGFTHIFGSFRLSRHMTKLAIALAAVLLTWGAGTVLDLIYTPFSKIYQGPPGSMSEPALYANDQFAKRATAQQAEDQVAAGAAEFLVGDKADYKNAADARKAAKDSPGTVRSQLLALFDKELDKSYTEADKAYDTALKDAAKEKDSDKRDALETKARDDMKKAKRQASQGCLEAIKAVKSTRPQGPFSTFVAFEAERFDAAANMIINRNVSGAFKCLRHMAAGLTWLASKHIFFALAFLPLFLVIWSLACGAIARAAALQATRDEKAGIGECLKFSFRKFLSFLGSPLVPIVVLLVIGGLTALFVSALGAIPGFGGIWIGLFFGMALIVGVAIAFLLIGLLAGGALMAPTIAVEGSDTFDACTRSYQFVLSRPWRAGLYGLVAAGYGAICYTFVRFMLFLVLAGAHWVVSLLTFYTSRDTVREGATKWDLMWAGPKFGDFHNGGVSAIGLNGFDWFGGWMVWCWVGLISMVLAAWVVSYLMSASTYIYLLLRKVEDATDMDEVYVEEPAEEPAPAAAAGAAAPAGETAPAGAAPATPPATTPPSGEPPKA